MLNALHDLHAAAGAEFQNYENLEIVCTYGNPPAEYSAVRTAAGLIDLPERGLLEISGQDRHSFLNNLLTNQIWDKSTKKGLTAGQGVYAFYLNTKGRIVCDVNVLELGDRCLLEMDGRLVEQIRQALDKYIFSEQVKINSLAETMHEIAVHGPAAVELLLEMTGANVGEIGQLANMPIELGGQPATLWRDNIAGVPGFNLIVPAAQVQEVWQMLITRFSQPDPIQAAKVRLRPFGWAVYNTTRIEAGRPLFGIDFDDSVLPAETGQMDRAVSLTKGCYLGQEIVARMHARGALPRKIVGIRMNDDALPLAGAAITDPAGNQIGGVTSSTVSPILSNACIALAILKKPFFEIGTPLRLPAEGALRDATVVEIPFVR